MTELGKFEAAFEALKKEAQRVEARDATLDEAIVAFERGMVHYQTCVAILDAAEQKIQMVINGSPVAQSGAAQGPLTQNEEQ